jgi:cell division protein FtsB
LVVFLPPFIKYQRMLYKYWKLEDEIKTLEKESKRLEIEKKRLEKDIAYIEGRAREKIGVVRKGEIILKDAPREGVKK